MSALLDRNRLSVAAAAALAVAAPITLLRDLGEEGIVAPLPEITPLHVEVAPPIDPALVLPLFNAARMPPPTPGSSPPPPPEQAAPPVPPPTLVGVIFSPSGPGVALIRTTDGTTALRIGEQAGGWKLLSVDRASATVGNGDRKETVSLDYGNKPKAGASQVSIPIVVPLPVPSLAEPNASPEKSEIKP